MQQNSNSCHHFASSQRPVTRGYSTSQDSSSPLSLLQIYNIANGSNKRETSSELANLSHEEIKQLALKAFETLRLLPPAFLSPEEHAYVASFSYLYHATMMSPMFSDWLKGKTIN
jgi:hypothetical protein